MLRNRLSTLLDIVKYLRQMARDNGTGQMRTLATRIDSNRPPGLSLAAFVRILKAANAAYTELHEIMIWCAQQQSQGRSEIRIKCEHLLLSIAKWKNDPYAGAEFVVHKQSILAAMERYKKGAGPLPLPG